MHTREQRRELTHMDLLAEPERVRARTLPTPDNPLTLTEIRLQLKTELLTRQRQPQAMLVKLLTLQILDTRTRQTGNRQHDAEHNPSVMARCLDESRVMDSREATGTGAGDRRGSGRTAKLVCGGREDRDR